MASKPKQADTGRQNIVVDDIEVELAIKVSPTLAVKKLRSENARMREALQLAIHVRGTSEDTPEILRIMKAAISA